MMYLLVRVLPWLSALAAFSAVEWQWSDASTYPYPLLAGFGFFAAAAMIIAWKRLAWREFVTKMIPPLLLWTSAALAMLVVEDQAARIVLTVVLVGTPLLVLELLFLLAVDPGRYPVHGLSRLNVALTPVTAFLLAAALDGLRIYLQLDGWVVIGLCSGFGALAFALTSHHASTCGQGARWVLLGLIAGLYAGLLVYLLPVSLSAAGCIAALITAVPLRMRRYAFQPYPGRRLALFEASGASLILAGILLLSRWA